MKLANLGRAALLVLSAAGLSACGKTLGPYSVEVKPIQKFELHTVSGKTLAFEADRPFDAMATFFGRKKLIQLNVGTEVIAFSGARIDKTTGQIIAAPEKTGQGIGVTVSQSLSCTPECELRDTRRDFESCTYYERERYTICRPMPHGGMNCYDVWRTVPRPGRQWVEIVRTTRRYDVRASLLDRSNLEVARASGQYLDRSEETHPISACF